jgi:hypothetical protein
MRIRTIATFTGFRCGINSLCWHRSIHRMVLAVSTLFLSSTDAGTLDLSEADQPLTMETLGSIYDSFERLDHSNAFDSAYLNFNWTSKLAVAFVNPALTKDSLNSNSRIYQDLYPHQPYWSFLTEEIAGTWKKNTLFLKVEWHTFPLKTRIDTLQYRDDTYELFLPDSSLATFHNTGCRFALLIQRFSPKMSVCGPKGMMLMYQNVAPEASKFENYAHSRIFYSYEYTYVLYDLLEGRVVQFGKAFDDNKNQNTKAHDIKRCLDDALMDVIEVSKFYRR